MDERAVSNVQKRTQKIVAMKGNHQIGAVSSAERGTNTTVVFPFNAAGHYVAPMFIFRMKRIADALKTGGPPGSHFECQEKGWMDSDLFVSWIQHFIRHVKPGETNPIFLILDGHVSHASNLKAIQSATANNIVALSLPPHCTHKLQSLDVGFFSHSRRIMTRPLNHAYANSQDLEFCHQTFCLLSIQHFPDPQALKLQSVHLESVVSGLWM
ncbi:tigger transposable element-derived protein [Elysia marginata]|uniref:Tigger transposable element-derived protein n=1 Tax=Elysia marginata TaxID=1093978 RepID=A0AAV4EZG3_9GAST|nr:tigger transposable element-derived protein [Elysia marginata]